MYALKETPTHGVCDKPFEKICLFCKWMRILPACMCVYYIHAGAYGSQKKVLSLELQIITGHVGAGNQTGVLYKSIQCS